MMVGSENRNIRRRRKLIVNSDLGCCNQFPYSERVLPEVSKRPKVQVVLKVLERDSST